MSPRVDPRSVFLLGGSAWSSLAAATRERIEEARRTGLLPPRGATMIHRAVPPARATAPAPVYPRGWAELALAGEIGCESRAKLSRELAQARAGGARGVLLELSSGGGGADDAFSMFDELRTFAEKSGPVVAFVPANARAASAATVPMLGADWVVMSPAAQLMVHCASPAEGYCDDAALDAASDATESITRLYMERTSLGTYAQIRGLLTSRDSWMSPWEAIGHGFADLVGTREQAREVMGALVSTWPECRRW